MADVTYTLEFIDERPIIELSAPGPVSYVGGEGGGGPVQWTQILGKPQSFVPTAHTHPISDVTDLQNQLNLKSNVNHSHDTRYLRSVNGVGPDAAGNVDVAAGGSGTPGPTGPAGPQGVAGPTGPKGDTGSTGASGIQGVKGDTGSQGPIGVTGAKGDKGDTGAASTVAGPQGVKGDTGAQGPIGLTGAKGDNGAQGPQGETGATGPQGPAGTGSGGSGSTFANYATANTATGFTVRATGGTGTITASTALGSPTLLVANATANQITRAMSNDIADGGLPLYVELEVYITNAAVSAAGITIFNSTANTGAGVSVRLDKPVNTLNGNLAIDQDGTAIITAPACTYVAGWNKIGVVYWRNNGQTASYLNGTLISNDRVISYADNTVRLGIVHYSANGNTSQHVRNLKAGVIKGGF